MLRRILEDIVVAILATCIIIVMLPVWIVEDWLHPERIFSRNQARPMVDTAKHP